MSKSIAALVSTAGLAIMATTAQAQTVSYDYDRTADFSQLRTYAWVPGSNLRDELNHKRIVDAIDAQMAARGIVRVDQTEHPDMLIAYHAAFNTNLEINGFSSGPVGYRWGRSSARVEEVVMGTLAVVMLDADTRGLLWRGIATREVDVNANPEKRTKNINKAIDKLFKTYPPKNNES